MCSIDKIFTHCKLNTLTNYPSTVYDSLLGNAITNKNLVVLENHPIILRRDYKLMKGRVKIIGGGGAGIEPSEAYYVGKGMLTAAVVGEIFKPPSANEILLAIRELAVDNPDGILLLVKNYVGDKLSFSVAMDQAIKENIDIKMLIIQDNIFQCKPVRQGRQGMAGSVLVYKILGEMAEQGKLMEEIIEEYEKNLLHGLGTASATLGACSIFNHNILKHQIDPEEALLGLGVYGKGGGKKIKAKDLQEVVTIILKEIIYFFNPDVKTDQYNIVVLVNNLGATSKFEEALIAKEVYTQLTNAGFKIIKLYVGTFMSSFATQGFSVSILKINSPETMQYLMAPTTAPAWPVTNLEEAFESQDSDLPLTVLPSFSNDLINFSDCETPCSESHLIILSDKAAAAMKQITIFAAEALISCEKQLNLIDTETGDGDLGSILRRGAEVLRKQVINDEMELRQPYKFLCELSEICSKYVGGLSGILYCAFFRAAAKPFLSSEVITPELCCAAFKEAVKAIKYYGKAELGERTMLDALLPAAESFESALKSGRNIIEAVYLAAITSFAKESSSIRPSIYRWKFLTEEETNYILQSDMTSEELVQFFEKKIGGEQTLLTTLLIETLKFCRKNYKRGPSRTSALMGSVYYTHRYFISSRWRTPAEVYFFFRECILRQSVESPPTSIDIFEPEEAKNALIFFVETYLRNLPLISILHVPHYKLQLKLKHEGVSKIKKLSTKEKSKE